MTVSQFERIHGGCAHGFFLESFDMHIFFPVVPVFTRTGFSAHAASDLTVAHARGLLTSLVREYERTWNVYPWMRKAERLGILEIS